MTAPAQPTYREVVDDNGRVYRVGETDRDILGRSRAWMVWLPWIAMMAISSSEYAFTSAEDTLSEAHDWHGAHIFWLLGVWVIFQAAVAFPAGRLRESGRLSARSAMLLGAGGALLGYLSLAYAPHVLLAYLGFGLFGGGGAGFVYATCINMVGKWYPGTQGREDGLRQRRLRLRVGALHLPVHQLHGPGELPGHPVGGRCLPGRRGRGDRLLLHRPAEELVAAARRPAEGQRGPEDPPRAAQEPACGQAVHPDGGDQDRHPAADVVRACCARRASTSSASPCRCRSARRWASPAGSWRSR